MTAMAARLRAWNTTLDDAVDVRALAVQSAAPARERRRTGRFRSWLHLRARLRAVVFSGASFLHRTELQELKLPLGDKTFVIRTPLVGEAVPAIQAVGVGSVRLAN